MKQFPLLPGQREHGNKGENDDGHGEKNRPPNLFACDKGGLPRFLTRQFFSLGILGLFAMSENVFRDDDGRIHQHADGNRDPC